MRLPGGSSGRVLVRFGLLSTGGALAGALPYAHLESTGLTRILGGLLLLTVSGLALVVRQTKEVRR
jgi:hypothetical protein